MAGGKITTRDLLYNNQIEKRLQKFFEHDEAIFKKIPKNIVNSIAWLISNLIRDPLPKSMTIKNYIPMLL